MRPLIFSIARPWPTFVMPKNNMLTLDKREVVRKARSSPLWEALESDWAGEGELLVEFIRALQTIRFGSIVVTLHDGRIVEVQKTERIRRNRTIKNAANET
jgi:hypothetical protein